MRIRLLKKTDIKEVAKLLVDSYKKEEKKRRWDLNCAEKYVLDAYRIGRDLCFVAVKDSIVIGVCLANISYSYSRKIIFLNTLVVHTDYRKNKVGSKLLRKLCIKGENKYNINEIETNVYTLTTFPINWLERIGFRSKKYYEITKASVERILKNT